MTNTLAHPPETDDATLSGMLSHFRLLEPVFDAMPDVVFFAKDRDGRYVRANDTLVMRCGKRHKRDVLGRTAEKLGEDVSEWLKAPRDGAALGD